MNTYDADGHFVNLLAHCHFQSHLFCLYSHIVRSALLVIIFWTNRCDQFFSLLQHLYQFAAYKVQYCTYAYVVCLWAMELVMESSIHILSFRSISLWKEGMIFVPLRHSLTVLFMMS